MSAFPVPPRPHQRPAPVPGARPLARGRHRRHGAARQRRRRVRRQRARARRRVPARRRRPERPVPEPGRPVRPHRAPHRRGRLDDADHRRPSTPGPARRAAATSPASPTRSPEAARSAPTGRPPTSTSPTPRQAHRRPARRRLGRHRRRPADGVQVELTGALALLAPGGAEQRADRRRRRHHRAPGRLRLGGRDGAPDRTAPLGIFVGAAGVGVLSAVMDVPEFSLILCAMIGLGVGIDYALFIVTRTASTSTRA